MWSKILERMMQSFVRHGSLTITLPDGHDLKFGDGAGPRARVRIADNATLRKLVVNPELALGEAYTDGTLAVDGDDIGGFLSIVIGNMDKADRPLWQRGHQALRTALRRFMLNNVPSLSRRNVAHHYDLSGDLYDLFLDSDRQYSCAYFQTPGDDLERAQEQKKHHIARKLRFEPDMHVLDIGCGWGGMALTLARDYGARVTGITLSQEQLAVAQRRVREQGLEDRIDIRLQDYRHITETFDRIVSVGMFEHVGLPHFDTYFASVHDLLAPNGIALIHTIGAVSPAGGTNAWMGKYIFPGGYIPSLSEMSAAIERQDLRITDIEFLWRHYAETLYHWLDRFEANVGKVEALYDARFVRMWRFYLAACEQAFRHRRQCVFQFQLTRAADVVPITRDYLYDRPLALHQAAE